jgi:hypothetical protein
MMTKEKYYAVRIGDPRYHEPYFMLRTGTRIPAIFETRKEAEDYMPAQSSTKVVSVWITNGKK